MANIYYQQIEEIHQVKRETIEEEITFLEDHPEKMEEIYERIVEELSKQRAEY